MTKKVNKLFFVINITHGKYTTIFVFFTILCTNIFCFIPFADSK